jgi:hypothetical protein
MTAQAIAQSYGSYGRVSRDFQNEVKFGSRHPRGPVAPGKGSRFGGFIVVALTIFVGFAASTHEPSHQASTVPHPSLSILKDSEFLTPTKIATSSSLEKPVKEMFYSGNQDSDGCWRSVNPYNFSGKEMAKSKFQEAPPRFLSAKCARSTKIAVHKISNLTET